MKSVKKLLVELDGQHGIRGVTVWDREGNSWQGLPGDEDGLCAATFGKIQTSRLIGDFLKLLKGKTDGKKKNENG